MGRTESLALGYAPDDEFDPRIDDFVSKQRNYLHFDLKLSESDRTNQKFSHRQIEQHSFWPLIGYVSEERRVLKDDAGALTFKIKERPIKFGSHADAALYQYYAKSLSHDYERFLENQSFDSCVLAYRPGVGNNIDQSKALFDEIRHRKNCTAVAMDIKGFFDHIPHAQLFENLLKVRGVTRLDPADFTFFRRMTKFEWVESEALKARLKARYGRNRRICTASEFRKLVRKKNASLVQINKESFGIPQGTPLSGLYANIMLANFDSEMFVATRAIGGSYRRYSGDIAMVFPASVSARSVIATVKCALRKLKLKLSDGKTEIASFSETGGTQVSDRPFQYLGFTFDGNKTLIRQSSLNRYYSKMHLGIRAKIRAAKNQNILRDEIFMRELFRKYTHFGKARNFPRYAYRAAKLHGSPEIRRQLRGHMSIFKRMVSSAVINIYG